MRLFFLQNHGQHNHTLQYSLIYFAVEQYSAWNYLSEEEGIILFFKVLVQETY